MSVETMLVGLLIFLILWVVVLLAHNVRSENAKINAILDRTAFDRQRDLLGTLWLYTNWRYVTKNLTTEQRELWADAIDEWHASQGEENKIERWWRD